MLSRHIFTRGRLAAVAFAALAATAAHAQAPAKAVSVEPVPALPAFTQWVETVVISTPVAVPTPSSIVVVNAVAQPATATSFQAWPVIMGAPELPLVRGAAAPSVWGESFNYQGMNVRLLILDREGRTLQVRSMESPPRRGERFRIRVTPTFTAVAEIDLVRGSPWDSQRLGQVYPKGGFSVELKASQTVDMPLGANEFFVMGEPEDRLLLSVRHPRATERARTQQPAYRQDGRGGSSYLQLIPEGRYPAFEQLIAGASR
ncbi:MAG: hypothetical protein JNJ71_19490 [Rubrivivax sp.]|nr:hypothetical protein [Rubrivivax sp.]